MYLTYKNVFDVYNNCSAFVLLYMSRITYIFTTMCRKDYKIYFSFLFKDYQFCFSNTIKRYQQPKKFFYQLSVFWYARWKEIVLGHMEKKDRSWNLRERS